MIRHGLIRELLVALALSALFVVIAAHLARAEEQDEPYGVMLARERGLWPAYEAQGRFVGMMRASWYGGGERLNKHTASGERFRPMALTAAHRTLPLGSRLRVTLGDRSVVVRVNDRGPAAWTGRSLDLSRGAARALGFERAGEARVHVAVY